MVATDKIDFGKGLMALGEVFKREVSDSLVEIYWAVFTEFSIEEFKSAVKRAVVSCEFFPPPAVLLKFMAGSPEERALMAWNQVKEAIHRHGSYESVRFEDGRIGFIIESWGGWPRFCSLAEREIDTFKRAEFLKTYQAIREFEPKTLCGLFELQNGARDPVVVPMIGAAEAKRLAA